MVRRSNRASRATSWKCPAWLRGGPEPSTVSETMFRADRLKTMRMRLSAAYKGVNALLMKEGAAGLSFRSEVRSHGFLRRERRHPPHLSAGLVQDAGHQAGRVRFDHQQDAALLPHEPDHRGRRAVGVPGQAGKGNETTPPIDRERLDGYLSSHLIDPALLRADDFDAFMADRQKRLLSLIEQATGKSAYIGGVAEEGEDIEADEDTVEAELTIAAA